MTIDFWACLIIAQIYLVTINRDNTRMLAFAAIGWFTLAIINLFSNIILK